MLPIIDIISGIFKPACDLIDDIHTSEEEKLQVKQKLMNIQTDLSSKVLDYESKRMEEQSKNVRAEIQGQSWLQRNWRPLLMICIVGIVANNFILFPYFSLFTDKVLVLDLPDKLYNLMLVGVGGYIGGRSAEKIIPGVVNILKKKEEV